MYQALLRTTFLHVCNSHVVYPPPPPPALLSVYLAAPARPRPPAPLLPLTSQGDWSVSSAGGIGGVLGGTGRKDASENRSASTLAHSMYGSTSEPISPAIEAHFAAFCRR